MNEVQRFVAEVEANFAKVAELGREGLLNNLIGCLVILGFIDASVGEINSIPGLDADNTQRFDYKLMKSLGQWLYDAVKVNFKAVRKIRSYKGFCERIDSYCNLVMAWYGFGRLLRIREGSFSGDEIATLEVIDGGSAPRLAKMEIFLSRDYERFAERFMKTKRYKEMISWQPFASFLKD
jgi:hypothetical protein